MEWKHAKPIYKSEGHSESDKVKPHGDESDTKEVKLKFSGFSFSHLATL